MSNKDKKEETQGCPMVTIPESKMASIAVSANFALLLMMTHKCKELKEKPPADMPSWEELGAMPHDAFVSLLNSKVTDMITTHVEEQIGMEGNIAEDIVKRGPLH